MGRPKKLHKLKERKESKHSRSSSSSSESEKEDKNVKKWEKVMDKAFDQKIEFESKNMEEKTKERFTNDSEIKTIINELYMKQKNNQYLVKKRRQTLKKFNLQEKIHREEIKIINDNEEAKNNEIFKEAIEKLAACHLVGFEPLTVIRQKILQKIQAKYKINEEGMKELKNYFESSPDKDKEINKKRYLEQIDILNKILSDTKMFDYNIDKNTYYSVKGEIKKYEKELELKASQNNINEPNNFIMDDNDNENDINNTINIINDNNKVLGYLSDSTDFKENQIKISELINEEYTSQECINKYKDTVLSNIKKNINNNTNNISNSINDYKEYKSDILNNLAWKFNKNKKFSNFEIQIILYITHSIIDELNCAKKNKREFSFIIQPTEMIKFLKQFQISENIFTTPMNLAQPKKSEHSSPSPSNINN